MILEGDRGAEESHETIAEKLVYRPLVAVDGFRHQPKSTVHELMHRLGVEPLGQTC